jgi:hypothetical protein
MVHEESAPFSRNLKYLLYGIMLLFFVIFLLTPPQPKEAAVVIIIVIAIMVYVIWSFNRMRFILTDNHVQARMPPFRTTVPYSDITKVTTIESIPWWVGYGIRIWGRRLAYTGSHGKSVVIEKEKGFFRQLILSAKDSVALAKKIDEQLKKQTK